MDVVWVGELPADRSLIGRLSLCHARKNRHEQDHSNHSMMRFISALLSVVGRRKKGFLDPPSRLANAGSLYGLLRVAYPPNE
jgi:hypothetical protein